MQNNSDFIPAPAAGDNSTTQPSSNTTVAETPPNPVSVSVNTVGLGTTQVVIGAAIILVAAVILYFVRSGIRNSLISSRATSEGAGFAATLWYAFLLLLTAVVVLGLLSGLFKIASFLIGVAVLLLAGLAICAVVTRNARRTRR